MFLQTLKKKYDNVTLVYFITPADTGTVFLLNITGLFSLSNCKHGGGLFSVKMRKIKVFWHIPHLVSISRVILPPLHC